MDTTHYIMEAKKTVKSKEEAFSSFIKWVGVFPLDTFENWGVRFHTDDTPLTGFVNRKDSFDEQLQCINSFQNRINSVSIKGAAMPLKIPNTGIGYVSIDLHFNYNNREKIAFYRFDDTGFINKNFKRFLNQNRFRLKRIAKKTIKKVDPDDLYIGVNYRTLNRFSSNILPNGDYCIGQVEYHKYGSKFKVSKYLMEEIRKADPIDVFKTKKGVGIFRDLDKQEAPKIQVKKKIDYLLMPSSNK